MAATTKKPPGVPPTPKPSSLADLERRRKGFVARGPSGAYYRLRQLNIERHAFAGGMPPALARIVTEGDSAVAELFQELAKPTDTPEEEQAKQRTVDYLDKVVLASVIDPALTPEHLGDRDDLASESSLPPADYMWLVSIALRSTEFDAEGRRLWGFEPEMQFQTFRAHHGCPDDCEHCVAAADTLASFANA